MVGIVSRPTHGRALRCSECIRTRTLTHGHELQPMGAHAGEWTCSSRIGLQSRGAVVELE